MNPGQTRQHIKSAHGLLAAHGNLRQVELLHAQDHEMVKIGGANPSYIPHRHDDDEEKPPVVSKLPRSDYWVVIYLAIVHWVWAISLLVDPSTEGATPLSPIAVNVPHLITAAVLIAASSMSVWSWKAKSHITRVALLLPQQALAYFSAGAGLTAVLAGKYADGVLRPTGFILADQVGTILIALVYTFVVIGASDKELR